MARFAKNIFSKCGAIRGRYDGTVSIIQPLIEPLYDSKSYHEVVQIFFKENYDKKDLDIVKEFWQKQGLADASKAAAAAAGNAQARVQNAPAAAANAPQTPPNSPKSGSDNKRKSSGGIVADKFGYFGDGGQLQPRRKVLKTIGAKPFTTDLSQIRRRQPERCRLTSDFWVSRKINR